MEEGDRTDEASSRLAEPDLSVTPSSASKVRLGLRDHGRHGRPPVPSSGASEWGLQACSEAEIIYLTSPPMLTSFSFTLSYLNYGPEAH